MTETFLFFPEKKMEKNVGFGAQSSAPLPTAPPSYEEAIANTGGAPALPSVVPTPYPLGNASVQMPMPCKLYLYQLLIKFVIQNGFD